MTAILMIWPHPWIKSSVTAITQINYIKFNWNLSTLSTNCPQFEQVWWHCFRENIFTNKFTLCLILTFNGFIVEVGRKCSTFDQDGTRKIIGKRWREEKSEGHTVSKSFGQVKAASILLVNIIYCRLLCRRRLLNIPFWK